MKKDYLDILCRPVCQSEMKLKAIKTNKDDIIEGTLICGQFRNKYFIRNGTAYLVPEGVKPESAYPRQA